MDKATAAGEIISYARCFIEINAANQLPKFVTLEMEEGEQIDVPVEFEWVPHIYKKCYTFGHQDSQCPTIQIWVPKEKQQVVLESAFKYF